MSIIHDALKKVQAGFRRQPPDPDTEPSPAPAHPRTKNSNFLTALITLLMLAGSVMFCYSQLVRYWPQIKTAFGLSGTSRLHWPSMPSLPFLGKKAARTPAPPAGPLAQVIVPAASSGHGVLNIQGVFSQHGTAVALINNKIYESGAEIGAIKILSISNDAIVILRDSKEETIPVRK